MKTVKINEDQDFVIIQPGDVETRSACQLSGPVSGINAMEAMFSMIIMSAERSEKRGGSEIIGKDGIHFVKEMKRLHDDFRRVFKVKTSNVRADDMKDDADLTEGSIFYFPPADGIN